MDKTSVFGLDPDQLDELLSLGSDIVDGSDPDRKANAPDPSEMLVEPPGSWIGRYQLLGVLGEGGMGIVYQAKQEHPIKRDVALKIIKLGMDTRQVIARFEAERQALALLNHPNIAHVYDAGATETGRPYFVMEYVKGLSITEHCDRHKLTIEDRLNLFRQVCLAVHHAHQKGIIHRDIKPSNILISTQDNQVVPKIIDFGVAKALAQPLTELTLATEESQLLGTPEYMSPEQADMATEDIDIRSDIYSLGVLLYVLLTGVLPFDSDTLREGGVEHIRQVIRDTDPKTPSTRLTNLGDGASEVAEKRRIEVAALAKCLHKELEWIPLKAMRKERAERYRSVSEFADDIENYLKGNPLIAGPESTVYQIRKFVRRKRALVTGIVTVLVVLVAGITISTIFAIGQARARGEAERATGKAQVIQDFLRGDVLGLAQMVKGREAMVIDVLNAAVAKLNKGKFQDQPLIEASIRETLGEVYFDLGYYLASAQQRERAYHIYLDQLGEEHRNTRKVMNMLAGSHSYAGNYREAEALFLKIQSDHYIHACCLAASYTMAGRYKEAERLFAETLKTTWWDPNHPDHHWALQFSFVLATVYREQGRYEDAEELFVKTLKAQREKYGSTVDSASEMVVHCMNELARLYVIQNRYKEAEALFTEGIVLGDQELPGKDHPLTLRHVNDLGVLRILQQQYGEAESLLQRALEGRKLKLGKDHPYTLDTIKDLGLLRREQRRYKDAEKLLTEALEGIQLNLGPDHPDTLQSKNDLAILYKEQARYKEAEQLLLEVVKGRRVKLGDTHPHTKESLNNLIDIYEVWNKPEKAKEWRAKLP
jgi:serine/threonine protein kinase/TolA-binding protein